MPMKNYKRRAGMLQSAARILLIPGWVIAIGIMLKGYADVGDGFAAGAIAAIVVLLQGLAFGVEEFDEMTASRFATPVAFAGLLLAFSVVFIPLAFGQPAMTHWPGINKDVFHFGVLEGITPVLFDIAVFMVVYGFGVGALVAVARAESRQKKTRERIRKRRDSEAAERKVRELS